MPIPTCILPSPQDTSHQSHVPRVLMVAAFAAIVSQAGCASVGAGASADEGAEPFDDSAAAPEIRSRTLEDVFLRVPGVSVTHGNTGRLMVRIQGGGTMTGSSVPLIVVDGALMPPGSIDFLNPKAIVSVEVVKNPAYTSLYGGRATNGVIRITTIRPRHE